MAVVVIVKKDGVVITVNYRRMEVGAITTEKEEVIIDTMEHLALPALSTTALVKISKVLSPFSFYITFPLMRQGCLHHSAFILEIV